MKVLLLHAYSTANAGDGLLVEESLELIREALGQSVEFTVMASHPETFNHLGVRVVDSAPGKSGYAREYLRLLCNLRQFDLVAGVGGGYLRAGYLEEAAKAAVIHGPQLLAAAMTRAPTIYLPQSVGPAGPIASTILKAGIRNLDSVYVRDDRSLGEFSRSGVKRTSDLAILSADFLNRENEPNPLPVVSVRPLRGVAPPLVVELCRQLGDFDGYIQSKTGGNDDRSVMAAIGAQRMLTRSELLDSTTTAPRVVVAVRLHAALMALRAGHFVIHLAYERKGFGAFEDLGLSKYVHNVSMFEPNRIVRQVEDLMTEQLVREEYRSVLEKARHRAKARRERIVCEIRSIVGVENAKSPTGG